MTSTPSSNKIKNISLTALLLTVSLALSYLEFLIPVTAAVPIPGFKPGFANIAVVVAYFAVSPLSAAVITVLKSVITSLLFSGVTTLVFSLAGGALAFLTLLLLTHIKNLKYSYIGLSVAMAFSHNVGQLAASVAVMGNASVLWYYPALVVSAVLCGALTGIILTLLPDRIYIGKV